MREAVLVPPSNRHPPEGARLMTDHQRLTVLAQIVRGALQVLVMSDNLSDDEKRTFQDLMARVDRLLA